MTDDRLEKVRKEQIPVFEVGDTITDGNSTFEIVGIENEHYVADDGDKVCFYVAHRYYTPTEKQHDEKDEKNKITEKQKIRTEVYSQFIKESYLIKKEGYTEYRQGLRDAYRFLLSFIDSMQEEPRFKIGQTITDPDDSTFTFHINRIEDGKYIESDDAWVLIKDADEEYQLVEEPVSKVWHDMVEEAENGRNIIIIDQKDFYGAVLRKGGTQLKNHNKERYVKWAYIDDIIKL